MKSNFRALILLLFFPLLAVNAICQENKVKTGHRSESKPETFIKYDDTRKTEWNKAFRVVGIKSPVDGNIQKAYFFSSESGKPEPLVVSLHTWSGNYEQVDPLAELCRLRNINYIHPDFRGMNNTFNACCSELALSDIDESITWSVRNAKVDTLRIYIIGVSGGGYATISAFMRSRHKVRKFSAWASITDLVSWYSESMLRKNNYAGNILACTGSYGNGLNFESARKRSPVYWETPVEKRINSELKIYAGIHDGITGSVPITHSVNFYNKVLSDMGVEIPEKFVTEGEKFSLLQYRKPLGDFGKISDRQVCLRKEYKNVCLVIFDGGHEMLPEFALKELLDN
jgi:pimeloyl-ACP methyl ester carboxylesterase